MTTAERDSPFGASVQERGVSIALHPFLSAARISDEIPGIDERATRQHVQRLEAVGFRVSLQPVEDTP